MSSLSSLHSESLAQWSPTLFLAGGLLLAGHASKQGLLAFTTLSPPPDVFVTIGHFVALLGLVGLYPVLADRSPSLERVAAAAAVVPLVGWLVMTFTKLLSIAGIVSSLTAALPGAFIMLVVGSTILTYVLFGAGMLRGGRGTRFVGLLVLVPAALFIVLLADSATTGVTELEGFIIGGGLALSMLTLGYTLRTWSLPKDHMARVTDPTAR